MNFYKAVLKNTIAYSDLILAQDLVFWIWMWAPAKDCQFWLLLFVLFGRVLHRSGQGYEPAHLQHQQHDWAGAIHAAGPALATTGRQAHSVERLYPMPTQNTLTLDLPQISLWHCVHFYTSLPKMETLSAPPLHHRPYEYSWEGRRPNRTSVRALIHCIVLLISSNRKEKQPAFLLWLSFWFIFC